MFQRRKLPPDRFPDDFDTHDYTRYRPEMRPGYWLTLRMAVPGILVAGVLLGVIAIGGVAAWRLFPPPEPEVIIVTPVPTGAAGFPLIGGDFPPNLTQEYTSVPAVIDNTLALQEQHAYRFLLEAGVQWEITITPLDELDPVLSLYTADGIIANKVNLGAAQPVIVTVTPSETAQYGIIVETAGGGATAGAYRLTIMPSIP